MKIANSYENCKRPCKNYTPKHENCKLIWKLQTDMKIANWYENCKLIWELQNNSHILVYYQSRGSAATWCPGIFKKTKNSWPAAGDCALWLVRRFVTARIGFSIDSDLHEKSLRRIRSRWFKNHAESDLYVFVSIHSFFCFPFRMNLLSAQKHWVRYYMVRQSYKIGSMLHVKSDLNVLIRFYTSRFDYRWIG